MLQCPVSRAFLFYFIANDYLEGSYNEENGLLRFDLYEGIGATNELFENPQYVFKSAMVEIDELELPSAYFLQSTSNESITINIVERISDMKKIQYIKEQTDRAYKYMMPKILPEDMWEIRIPIMAQECFLQGLQRRQTAF